VPATEALKKLKKAELVNLAASTNLIVTNLDGKILSYNKDKWIDLILQYSHLA
jgi:hypothetical protein